MGSRRSAIEASCARAEGGPGERSAKKKDGNDIFVRPVDNVRDRLGRSISIMYSFVDATDLRNAKEELRKYLASCAG